jgi:hypothetical protein
MRKSAIRRFPRPALLLAAAALLPAAPAAPAEIAVFVSGATPDETWGRGYGGMLTVTFFNLVHGEVEGAWQDSFLPSTSLVTVAAKAYIGPTIAGRLVPYAGLGAGAFLKSLAGDDERGTGGLVFVGAKVKFPFGLVLRGEYQWLDQGEGTEQAPVDQRYFLAVGLSF